MLRKLTREERSSDKVINEWMILAKKDKDMRTTCKWCRQDLTFKQVNNENIFCSNSCGKRYKEKQEELKKLKQIENKKRYKKWLKKEERCQFGVAFDDDGNYVSYEFEEAEKYM